MDLRSNAAEGKSAAHHNDAGQAFITTCHYSTIPTHHFLCAVIWGQPC
jgi:hypothetical protein